MGYDPFAGDHAAQQLWPTSREIEVPAEVQPLELPEDVAGFEREAATAAPRDIGDYRSAPPIIGTEPIREAAGRLSRGLSPSAIVGMTAVVVVALALTSLLVLLLAFSIR